jgi:hypothetical protein
MDYECVAGLFSRIVPVPGGLLHRISCEVRVRVGRSCEVFEATTGRSRSIRRVESRALAREPRARGEAQTLG